MVFSDVGSTYLTHLIQWIDASKYLLLFIGAIVEGPILMVASGFLFRLGQLDFLPMYIALVSGDFCADMGWYGIGYFGARPFIFQYGKFFGITPERVEKIAGRFKKYQDKILIISKLTMGFGFALVTLVVAGILKVPFKKYVTLNLLGGFVWTALLVLVGFFFGNVYLLITPSLKIAFVCIAALIVFIAFKFGSRELAKMEI